MCLINDRKEVDEKRKIVIRHIYFCEIRQELTSEVFLVWNSISSGTGKSERWTY